MTTSRSRYWMRAFLVLTGVFFLIALFFTTSNFFIYKLQPADYHLAIGQEFLLFLVRWMPWVLLAPAVMGLARRFPLRSRRWPAHLAVHAIASLLVSGLQSSLCVAIYRFPFKAIVGLPEGTGPYLSDYWLTFLNQVHNNILTYAVILIVVWGLEHLRLLREKELVAGRLEAELARANLMALESQVHPHFLFNTLHMISAMVYEDPATADRMISRLSDLLRATLESPEAPTVPLRDELETLSLYLDIMKARFGDRLVVGFEIAPEALGALVPSFGLQPLVENAIKHGVMPRDEGGRVRIAARRVDGRLVVGVEDDGPGLKGPFEALLDSGVGLRNLRSRLLGLYGGDGVLRLGNGDGGGARIEMDIPFRATEG
jgi:two-component system, LytTR family, sensor kinase